MSEDIPLLRESSAFSRRLFDAGARFGEHRHRHHQRVNWSWRFAAEFFAHEANLFKRDPNRYMANQLTGAPVLADVFARRLTMRETLLIVSKVATHMIFAICGRLARGPKMPDPWIYRKAYVDDIELVYDPDATGVLRAVYPFPISPLRQWRYLVSLRRARRPFRLDGNHYSLRDLIGFLRRRDVGALLRLECRGELRRAQALVAERPALVELSDEFNVGSLTFARYLARAGIETVNVAHGVGKYFPVHAYQNFRTLTERQVEYYFASGPCAYGRHVLNANFDVAPSNRARATGAPASRDRTIVILSQDFGDPDSVIAQAEHRIISAVATCAGNATEVRIRFKPHPNRPNPVAPSGFELVSSIDELRDTPNPIMLSMFSTTHIDPRFEGRKYLVRSPLIRPEIAFDDDGCIVEIDELEPFLTRELSS